MTRYAPAIVGIPMPAPIMALPVDPIRQFPVPWFVHWIDGKPEFRVIGHDKLRQALEQRLCWICGQPLASRVTFVIGPMCTINRVSSEPPSHRECAEYAAQACPFLARPHMVRREAGMPEGTVVVDGFIDRNPGVMCLWTTRAPGCTPVRASGGVLFELYPPTATSWWREGRTATRAEVLASIESGLPLLEKIAHEDGPGAVALLEKMRTEAEPIWPQEGP